MTNFSNHSDIKRSDLKVWLSDSNEHLVVLIFVADWAGSVAILRGFMERILRDEPELVVIWVDIEKQPEITLDLGVASVPTVVLLRNQEVVDHIGEVLPRKKLAERIALHI